MVNKVLLVGRLCTDPELKYTPGGVAVANFRVAVDRPFVNALGERETDFIDVVAWRQHAEYVNSYIAKGRLVMVDGRLQVRQWQTQDGQRRRSTEVVADQIRALDRPRETREAGEARNMGNNHDDLTPPPPPPALPEEQAPCFDTPDITADPFADQ